MNAIEKNKQLKRKLEIFHKNAYSLRKKILELKLIANKYKIICITETLW